MAGNWIEFNNNPISRRVGDCAVRAVAKALETDWESAYIMIAKNGFQMCDMPSSDAVWGSVLRQNGFSREIIPNTCPDCFSVIDFCKAHPNGRYVLGTGSHAVCVVDGSYYDIWDCGKETVIYAWKKET